MVEELGISDDSLYTWRKQLAQQGEGEGKLLAPPSSPTDAKQGTGAVLVA